jgi:hypothetical protein
VKSRRFLTPQGTIFILNAVKNINLTNEGILHHLTTGHMARIILNLKAILNFA